MARHTTEPRLVLNRRGIYEIRWTDTGRRSRTRSTCTRNLEEARESFAQWLLKRGAIQTAKTDPTVADALRTYMAEHIEPGEHDVARHRVMQRWLEAGLGARKVVDLRPSDGVAYTTARRSGEVGARAAQDGTIRRELGMLQAALYHLVRERRLTRDQVTVLKRPAEPQAAEKWLTRDQVDVLLQWFADQDRGQRMSRVHRFVVLGLATAARKNAIETLRWPLVDRKAGLVRYDRQVSVQTRKRRVAAPIADWLEPYLERMHAEAVGEWVLDHGGDITSAYRWAMRQAAVDTGDETLAQVDRHTLRHTAATLALQNGATLWQVAGLLGDNPETVARVYGHHAQDHVRAAANWR